LLAGTDAPASAAEGLEVAKLCSQKGLKCASARFYEEAFAKEPKLAAKDGWAHYSAACAAALAGCGQGKDAGKLDYKERARLRRLALGWLRADLKVWGGLLEKGPSSADVAMKHWLADRDFAGVRGKEALGKLPEGERREWEKLWSDVAGLLARAQTKAR
jgi:hypothetical protein